VAARWARAAGGKASDHADNFDIYLPKLIARHNKVIFGLRVRFGKAVVLWRWLM